METKQVKGWVVLLCMVIVVSACSSSSPPPSIKTGPPADLVDARTRSDKLLIYVPDDNKPTPTGDLMNDATAKYMGDMTNTQLDIQFLPNTNYAEHLKLKFAAKEYPDAFLGFGLTQQDGALANDLVLPLNDLIEEHGPHLKTYIPQEAWDAVTVKGQIMGIPQPSYTPSARIFFIRQDWLDRLNLEVPKTSDEFLDMLRAFRDHDMNGNGDKTDEIPLLTRAFAWNDENIWGMWGLAPGSSIEWKGEVVPGFAHPNFKEALRFMQTAYQEKLLDPEFLSSTLSTWRQKIHNDQGGVFGWLPEGAWDMQNEIDQALPGRGANLVAMATPRGTGYEGPVGASLNPVGKTFLIMKSSEHPEAAVRFFDWLVSEEGQILTELGLEGDNYEIVDGRLSYMPDPEKQEKNDWRSLFQLHGYNEQVFEARLNDEQRGKVEYALKLSRMEGFEHLTYSMPALGGRYTEIYSAWREPAAKIIVDGLPVDSTWDAFLETWRSQGGDELIAVLTEWYPLNGKESQV